VTDIQINKKMERQTKKMKPETSKMEKIQADRFKEIGTYRSKIIKKDI
jgi:hypothetical protein